MAWWTPIEACSPDRGLWEDSEVNLARAALSGVISSGPQTKLFPSWQNFHPVRLVHCPETGLCGCSLRQPWRKKAAGRPILRRGVEAGAACAAGPALRSPSACRGALPLRRLLAWPLLGELVDCSFFAFSRLERFHHRGFRRIREHRPTFVNTPSGQHNGLTSSYRFSSSSNILPDEKRKSLPPSCHHRLIPAPAKQASRLSTC